MIIEHIAVGLDFETTGIDDDAEIIEYAMVSYCTKNKLMFRSLSNLVKPSSTISQEIIELTGINQDLINLYAIDIENAVKHINHFFTQAKFLIAHNADFELKFLNKYNINYSHLEIIDTMKDIEYPKSIKCRDLERLSLIHRCPNFNAHRALPDVLVMIDILKQYSFDDILEYKKIPIIKLISLEGFDKKDIVKNLGFIWEAKDKVWFKDIKQNKLQENIDLLNNENIKHRIIET